MTESSNLIVENLFSLSSKSGVDEISSSCRSDLFWLYRKAKLLIPMDEMCFYYKGIKNTEIL